MDDLSLIYYVFTFAFGLGTLFTYILIVLKTRSLLLFHILVFYIVFTLSIISHIYRESFGERPGFLAYELYIFVPAVFVESLFIFSIPFFTGYIANLKHRKLRNFIFAFLALLNFIHTLGVKFSFWEPLHLSELSLFGLLLNGSIAFSVISALLNYRNIEDRENKVLLRNVCIVATIFFPFTVYEQIYELPILINPLLYCSFCVVFIIFIVKIYFRDYYLSKEDIDSLDDRTGGSVETTVFDMYSLSEREREVISLVLKGYSNKKIAEMLFISVSTVKTHIHNTFQKTKTSNRYELIHLIKFK